MIIQTPTKFFLVAGASEGFSKLNSFDCALLASGIGNTNILKMSSILPPKCKRIEPVRLPYGSLIPTAYASITSDQPGEIVSAAVAVAIPERDDYPGLIMEYSSRGKKENVENIVKKMAEEGMKVRNENIKDILIKGIEFNIKRIGTAFAAVVLWD
ncbi:arginine decarboxylase, pyruvoyl-dependent [candidate division WOR-3 bacterium]|jgi:arginine decarboxylase|nr:arginine decarboxylase, pyruvoyl-dependent [candidate division WOR-3 bacterium]